MPGWYGAEDRGHRRLKELVWGGRLGSLGEVLREWGGQGYQQYWGASKFHPELSAV